MALVKVYTDGACRGNPGPGGWGVVLIYQDHKRYLSGAESNTTNNRMELMAVIQALSALKYACQVEIYTDSKYVQQGITEWIYQWQNNQWKTKDKKDVKNKDLWLALWEQQQRHQIDWHWVRGHADCAGNIEADRLARDAILNLRS